MLERAFSLLFSSRYGKACIYDESHKNVSTRSRMVGGCDIPASYALTCDTYRTVMIRFEDGLHKLMQWLTDNGMKATPSRFQRMFLWLKGMSKVCLNIKGRCTTMCSKTNV